MPQFAGKAEFEVNFMPFSLYPDLPGSEKPEGINKQEYLANFNKTGANGPPEKADQRRKVLFDAWKAEGLNLSMGGNTGSSVDAHRLVSLARKQGREDETVDALYSSYHEQERCLSDHNVLLEVADKAGVVGAKEMLETDQELQEVRSLYQKHHMKMGIKSVPFFIFNETFTDSGAPEEPFLQNLFSWMVEGGDFVPRFLPDSMRQQNQTVIPGKETRFNPIDNKVYTFKEFVEAYGIPKEGGHHTLTDMTFFWADRMFEVSVLQPGVPPEAKL